MSDAAPPPDASVLDRAHLADVSGGDAELCAELVALYREHGEGDRERIEQAAAHEDRDGLRLLAHGMKGASASLGAVRAARAFEALEHGAADAELAALRSCVATAQAAFEEACQALDQAAQELGGEGI